MLEALECANLFLVPLDEERRWYRYHHLFGEFLRERLEREQPWASSADHSMVSLNEQRRVLLARALLAEGRGAEATDLLRRFVDAAATEGRRGSEARFLALLALAAHAQGDVEAVVETLGRALPLAEAGGYVRSFVDEGPAMQALLRCAVVKGVEPLYASRLLASFAASDGTPRPLPGILSNREREMLRLVASGMSNEGHPLAKPCTGQNPSPRVLRRSGDPR